MRRSVTLESSEVARCPEALHESSGGGDRYGGSGRMAHRFVVALLTGLVAVGAALADSIEDVTFDAEHLLESDMDAQFATLALASGRLEAGVWQPTVGVAHYDTNAGLYRLEGASLGLGLARGLSDRWSLQTLGFLDRADIGGDRAVDELLPLFTRDIPFSVPVNAELTNAGGEVRHWAVGFALTRQVQKKGRGEGLLSWSFGLLHDRLEASDFSIAYRLTEGADAGTTGLLDLSATYSFETPFCDVRYSRKLGKSWRIESRATAVLPLPRRGLVGRIEGPGFDLSGDTEQADHGVHMGDPALALGLCFEHTPSHLALDVGALLVEPLYERVTHKGVDQALLFHLRWHGGHRR